MSRRDDDNAKVAIFVIIALAAIIAISRQLFPIFLIITIIFFIVTIISFISQYDSYYPDNTTTILFIAFTVSLILTVVFYLIGYEFGNSRIGIAVTEVAKAIHIIEEAEENATIEIIESVQEVTEQMGK